MQDLKVNCRELPFSYSDSSAADVDVREPHHSMGWQEIYNPLFVDVDARQLSNHPNAMAEEYFKGWRIAGYKRPILLSCNHRKVKIVKGKVWLEMPK